MCVAKNKSYIWSNINFILMKKYLLSIAFIAMNILMFAQLTVTETHTNVSCFGTCNATAVVSVSGGTPPYTYSCSPAGSIGPTIANLCPGNYTVTVMDASANTGYVVVTIMQPPAFSAYINTSNSCNGTCKGTSLITALGGTPPYQYSWSNGGVTTQQSNLCAGSYTISVTDVKGCVITTTTNIIQSAQMNVVVSQTNALCYTNCNGSASISSLSGGSAPYTYQWSPSGSTMPSITNLCPGNYSITVGDALGCSKTSTINIVSLGTLSNLSASLTTINETCYLSSDGSINLNLYGTNSGPFTYQWSNGASSKNIANVSTGNYWVEIKDGSSGCLGVETQIYSSGVNCGSVSGNVFLDNNSNCINDAGDNTSYGSIVMNPGNRIGYTNGSGNYIINNLPYGTYSISLNNNSAFVPSCTQTVIATVSATNPSVVNNDFSVGFNSTTNPDMKISSYNNGIAPGFSCYVNYNLSNLNNVAASGLFKAILPNSFIPFITGGIPNTYLISGDTVIWNFNNITYSGGSNYFKIYFTVPLNTSLGSTFTTCSYVKPNILDFDYTNNNDCYSRIVTGAFDPNDKSVSPVGLGVNGNIAVTETDLTYLIRFQNTGNGPAVNIVIKDTLSPNVNVATFEMLNASHNYNIDILPGNVLRWKFNNIMLPDSHSNNVGSHGYIQYRIRRTNNNIPGTQIKNTAYIYFDFNAPIVTNTAINTISTVTGINFQNNNDNQWLVYPNPSSGLLNLVNNNIAVDSKSQIAVVNTVGQIAYEEYINSNYKTLDISKLNNGIYFLRIISDKQTVVKRIVLSR